MDKDAVIENAIHGKDRPKTKRGLVVLLCVLLVIIVGLSIGVWVVSSNNQSSDEYETEVVDGQNLTDEAVENLIVEYQERIDTAASDEEKILLYEERYYMLTSSMEEDGIDYCLDASDDLGKLFVLVEDKEKISELIEAMPSECIQTGESGFATTADIIDGEKNEASSK